VSPANSPTHPWRGYILIAAASFCWGASATFGKALFSGRLFGEHTHISPLVLSQARTTFAVLLLCAFLLARYGRSFFRMARRDFALCLLVGTLGLAGSNYFYYLAIQKSTVALAITLQYTAPLWVLITMVLRGRERFTILRVSSVLLAMVGIALTIGLFRDGVTINRWGAAAAMVASFSFAFAHECSGKKDREDWFQATGHDGPCGIQIFQSAEVEKIWNQGGATGKQE